MPTLTLDLPENAYRAAQSFAPHEQVRLAAEMFTNAEAQLESDDETDEDESLPDYDRPTNEDDLAAIGRGLQAAAEGRTTPGEIVFARLHARAREGRTTKS